MQSISRAGLSKECTRHTRTVAYAKHALLRCNHISGRGELIFSLIIVETESKVLLAAVTSEPIKFISFK
jgi:hypothetical protein